jgi:hypothetical protein
MDGLEKFRSTPNSPPSGRDLLDTAAGDLTLQAVLFKALHGFSKQSKGMLMLYNLQAAAFHLSFMLKGYTMNDKLVSLFRLEHESSIYQSCLQAVPTIPDSCDAFYNAWVTIC